MSQVLLKRASAKAVPTADSADAAPLAEAARINGKSTADCMAALKDAAQESEKLRDSFLKVVSEYQTQANAVRDLMYKAMPSWDLKQTMSAEQKSELAALDAKVRMNLDLRKMAESVW